MAAVVSAEEFGALQEQLMKLKEEKYEALDREKKLKREVERLTKAHADAEALSKKNAELLAKKEKDNAPSPATPVKGLDQLKVEHSQQVDSLKQTIALLTQERDRLAKGAAPAPRKEAVEKAITIDRAAITARLVSDPPVQASIIDTVETILKEQATQLASNQADAQSLKEKCAALEKEVGALREVNAKLTGNVEETTKGSESAKKAAAELEKMKADLAAAHSDRDVLAARIGEKELRLDSMSDKVTGLQAEAKKSTARIEELTKEQADTAVKLSAAQGEAQKSEAKATDLQAKLTALTEERDKAIKERDAAKTELEQLNQQVRQFTTSREEYITELKKGRDMLEETLEKRGAIVTALEQRLKEATEAASSQSERVKQLTADLATAAEDLVQHRNALDQFQAADKENNERIMILENELAKAREEAEMASKIAEKKTARQVKDLQEQLQRERAMRGVKGTPSVENLAAATAAPGKGPKVSEPTREDLIRETNMLAMRLGELQTEKSAMEQRNKHLNETLKFMNTELEKKEALIKHGLMNMKTGTTSGRSTPDQDRQKLKTGSAFGKEGINDKEVYAKMERLTEETIMRNLQLMTDIKVLGDEVARITDENKKLRAAAAPAPAAAPVASPPAPSLPATAAPTPTPPPPSVSPAVASPLPSASPAPSSPAPVSPRGNGPSADAPKAAST